jgi:hypothetical protein
MTALNMQSFDAALKVHYTDLRVKNLVYKNNPFLAAIPKYEAFGGRNLPIPVQFGVPEGRSQNFQDALGLQTAGNYTEFVLTRVRNYGIASIGNEVLEASVGDANAFMQAASSEIDGILRAVTQDLAGSMYGTGFGNRGTIGALNPAPPVPPAQYEITLAEPADVVRFEVGMALTSNVPGGLPATAKGLGAIVAVNRDTGVLTIDPAAPGFTFPATPAIGAAPAVGEFLFQWGDDTSTRSKITGLGGWLPDVAPVAGDPALFGVQREVDPTRLAGVRYNGSGMTIEEALISASALLFREGGRPDICFVNPVTYADLIKSLGSKVVYDLMRSSDVADVFFEAVRVHTPSGAVSVVADPNCPVSRAYLLQMDTWKLYSLGMAPKILMTDGMRILRNADSDSVQVRTGFYAQMGTSAPGWNCNITLPPVVP